MKNTVYSILDPIERGKAFDKIKELILDRKDFRVVKSYKDLYVEVGDTDKMEKYNINSFPKKEVSVYRNGELTEYFILKRQALK